MPSVIVDHPMGDVEDPLHVLVTGFGVESVPELSASLI
jgi:hypothetical protein